MPDADSVEGGIETESEGDERIALCAGGLKQQFLLRMLDRKTEW
jgi:hypothetical protein